MNPLEPNDPLWNLLGKARDVEVRGNFVQNVVRAARQVPQERGFWPRVKAWFTEGESSAWFRPAFVAAAIALVSLGVWRRQTGETVAPAVVSAPAPVAQPTSDEAAMIQLAEAMPTMPLETINEVDALLAMDDASAMTDTELAFLLY